MAEIRLEDGIAAVLLTIEGDDSAFLDNDFVRGQANLLAELFPVPGMPTSDRLDEILRTIREHIAAGTEPFLTDRFESEIRAWHDSNEPARSFAERLIQIVRNNTTYEGD